MKRNKTKRQKRHEAARRLPFKLLVGMIQKGGHRRPRVGDAFFRGINTAGPVRHLVKDGKPVDDKERCP